ncbi:MAG: metalloregulator ArsR/SmtB family transcription factor [bacterium]
MSDAAEAEAARFFQALGDPTRLALLEELRGGEKNVGELVDALGCPQPKVSRHLKVLKAAGLVRDRREGRHVGYALSTSRAWPAPARQWMGSLESGLPLEESRAAMPSEERRGAALAPRPAPSPSVRPETATAPAASASPAEARPEPARVRRPSLEAHLL